MDTYCTSYNMLHNFYFPPPPQNVMHFIMWSFLYHIIFTFYIQKRPKIWMPNPGF
jgi:hypothetical protein